MALVFLILRPLSSPPFRFSINRQEFWLEIWPTIFESEKRIRAYFRRNFFDLIEIKPNSRQLSNQKMSNFPFFCRNSIKPRFFLESYLSYCNLQYPFRPVFSNLFEILFFPEKSRRRGAWCSLPCFQVFSRTIPCLSAPPLFIPHSEISAIFYEKELFLTRQRF